MLELKILTGPSGSGITSAKFIFEELGYYIVENPPLGSVEAVLTSFTSGNYRTKRFCLIVPISVAGEILKTVKENPSFKSELVLLATDPKEIIKRYRLSRHMHPRCFERKMGLEKAISLDNEEVGALLSSADIYIDTTALSVKSLRMNLYHKLTDSSKEGITSIYFVSFGYKNGMPMDMDMIFDVRSIPNPYWVEELKSLNGNDEPVIQYMNSFPETKEIIDNIISFLQVHLAYVQKTGRANYNIGIACSGGQHRSTYVANVLAKHFAGQYKTQAVHRDSPALNEGV